MKPFFYTTKIALPLILGLLAGFGLSAQTKYTLNSSMQVSSLGSAAVHSIFLQNKAFDVDHNKRSLTIACTPTLGTVSQDLAIPVCAGTPAIINLTGLLVSTTHDVTYTINGGVPQTATGILSDINGDASFTTINLVPSNTIIEIILLVNTDEDPDCSQVFSVTASLSVREVPVANATALSVCPTAPGGLTGDFTLSDANSAVNLGNSFPTTISYHATLADANADANALPNGYNSANAIIYARVENTAAPNCYATSTVALTVYPSPSAGSITSGERLICEAGDPAAFTATVVSGVTYQWQYSQNGGGSWSNAMGSGGVTNQNYNIPSGGVPDPEITTLYRRQVTSTANGCTNNSNAVTVYVNTIDLGSISSGASQTICVGGAIASIDATTPVSISGAGLVVTTTFQWQQSANGINGWANIAGATAEDYMPAGLGVTTYFRRIVSVSVDGSAIPTNPTTTSCSKTPASWQAVVYVNAINPGTINRALPSNVQTICENGDPAAFAAPAAIVPAGAVRTYLWEYRAKGSSDPWVAAPGTNSVEDYNAPAASIAFDAEFQRKTISVLNGVSCEAISVNYPTVDINEIPDPGTISYAGDPDFDICSLVSLEPFYGTAGAADGAITYQWRSSTTTNVDPLTTNIAGGTGQDLPVPPATTVTTHFGRRITSTLNGVGCKSFSNVITITVNPNPNNPSITPSTAQSFCTSASSVDVSYTITVGSGGDIVEWSFDDFVTIAGSGVGTQIITVPAPTPNPPGFVTTTIKFRSKKTDTGCISTGISRMVNFYPPATVLAGSDAAICYNGTVTLNGAVGGGATDASWTANVVGGTFMPNANTLNATYTPPTNYSGNIDLTLTTNDPTGPCGPSSDQMTITVYDALTTSISGPANVCINGDITLTGSSSGGSGTVTGHTWAVTPGTGNASITNGSATAILTGTQSGTVTVTYTVTDDAGCQVETTGTLAVTVDAAPTLSNCPDNFNLNTALGLCTATESWTHPSIAGLSVSCAPASLSVDYGLGGGFVAVTPGAAATQTFPLGLTTVTYKLTDNEGNVAFCSFVVLVVDNQDPVIATCPVTRNINGCLDDISGPAYSLVSAPSTYAEFSDPTNQGEGSDNCSLTVSYQDQISGTCPIVVTRTWTLSDGTNTTSCEQTINVTPAPAVFAATDNISIPCGSAPPTGTPLLYTNGASGACEISGSVTGSIIGSYTECGGTYTETWAYTDDCGRTIDASRIITVEPAAVAAFAPTSDISIACGSAPPTGTSLSYTNGASGACEISGSVTGTISGSHTECGGTYTETWTYIDDCGRTIDATRTITVEPAAVAAFAPTSDISIACGSAPPEPSDLSYTNGASGACEISGSVTSTINGLHTECGGTYTETWTYTDDCGRTITASRTITVDPAAPAAFAATDNISIPCGSAPPTGTSLSYTNGATGACEISGSVTGTIAGSHTECGGIYTETWTYTDDCARTITVSRIITVEPAAEAAFAPTSDINIACGSAPPAPSDLTYTNGASGACEISGSVTSTIIGSYTECGGTYTETWTYTDDCARTITASRTITVDPAALAVFAATDNISIPCGSAPPTGTSLSYTNGETGACEISGSVTGTINGSHTECGGIYTETWTYTDDCGRTITVSRIITVDPAAVATFAPTSDISIACGSAPPAPSDLSYTNGASGACEISGSVTSTINGSYTECGGTYTETWTYTDDCSRTITASRTITVEPATVAAFAPTSDISIACGSAPPVPSDLSYTNGASGACEISGSVTGSIIGSHTECGGIYTESWTYTDDCGRTIDISRIITVEPAAQAAFAPTSDINIACGSAPPAPSDLTYTNGASGACEISGSVTGTIIGSHTECGGTYTETWTYTDDCGRTIDASRTITVDPAAVAAFAPTSDINITCGSAPPAPSDLTYTNGETGACEISGSVTGTINGSHTECGGTYTESWTYTDNCGRTIDATRIITVEPAAVAAFAPTSDISIACGSAPPAPSDLTYTNGASGACEISGSVMGTIIGSHTECGGTYTESWTYTDDCGRTIDASRTITVEPAAVAAFAPTSDISIACGSAPPAPSDLSYTNGASGACEISGSITGSINGSHTECGGIYTETWTYTDDCGRTIDATRTITVEPAAVAAFAPTSDISIACGSAPPAPSDLSYTNGASGACEISGSITGSIIGSHTECGGIYTETWTYTDDCGRTIDATRTITVEPAAVAVFAPTSDISIACGSAPPAPSDLSYTNGETGACEISGSVTGSIIGSHTECGGTYTETWTYTDDCGRTIDASRLIVVEPAAVAAFAPTSDISIACGSAPPAPSDLSYTNGASGACEISGSVTGTIIGSHTECGGIYTESWTYTDDCGRTIDATRTITVEPAAVAAFAPTSDISIACGSAPPTGTSLSYTNGETGACEISGSVTGSIIGSHTECGGSYTESWTYTDNCGRTIDVSRIITVEPAAVAAFAPTSDINIACGSAPPAPSDLLYTNGETGACEISGSVTGSIIGSHTECGGTYTETWTYTDDCARTITASRTITVDPAAEAAFAPTTDISIACGSAPPTGTSLSYTNGASDACEISGSVTGSIIGSHTECGGTYTESWTYTDDCGRTITASRTITVEPAAVAAFAPTSDISIACGSAPPAPSDLSYTNGASGACEISGSITGSVIGSHTECGGIYTESWTYTDDCGRTIDATRTITVEPAAVAAFAPTSDISIACGSAPPAPSDLSYTNGETGACEISGSVTGTIIGSHTECGGSYTETWTYTDNCGRTIDVSRIITVEPAAIAAFAPTSDISIACGSAPPVPSDLSYTNGASGACEISGSVTGTIIGSHTECGGTYTESWTYTDNCGRTIDVSRIITVEPAAVAAFAPTSDISIACGSAPPAPSDLSYTNGETGACEISGSVTGTIIGSHTECGGSYTESWTYTDDCGRTIDATRTITVEPAAVAAFAPTSDISIACGSAPPTGTSLSYTNGETGACEISGSVTGSIIGSHTECGGSYTESWTYTDNCGRTIDVSRIITVEPAAVAAFAPTSDINIACGSAPPAPSDLLYTNGETGACEISGSVTGTINGSHTECGGTYTETWTYTDDCARTITTSRTITVDPAAEAAFAPTTDINIACGSAPPTGTSLSYTNGASGACEISGSVTGTIIGSHTECGGTYTETWTYTDDCGRTITASRTITVDPAAEAAFAPTSDISIACGSAPPAPSDLSYTNGASGACEISGSITGSITGSHTECGGTYTETWTFTDNCGRTIDASRLIVVEPAAVATFAPVSDISITCGSAPPAPSDLSYTNGASGACEISGSVTSTINGSYTECGGTYTETWTYTDNCGRTIDASRLIVVEPAAVATFAPTSDINIACGSAPPAPSDLSYTNGETGACEISGSITGSITGSHDECGGTYTETWTYTDDCGRTIDASRLIVVDPADQAAFAPTSDINIACGSAPPAPSDLTYTNGAAGACEISGSVTGTVTGSHDECGGTYTETWTYTDDCGRTIDASRLIVVDPALQAAFAPVSDISIACGSAPPVPSDLTYTNGSTGACEISGSVTGTINGSHTECGGTYTESWTYTDDCGRTIDATRTITVEPAAQAAFAPTSDISIACGSAPPAPSDLTYTNGSTGVCEISGSVTSTISGTHTECGGTYTESWTYTDNCGRTIDATRTITVEPAAQAVFAPTSDISIACGSAPPAPSDLSYTNGAAGACEISGSVTSTIIGSYTECGGTYTESWTYTDECGRTIDATRTITVEPAAQAAFAPTSDINIACGSAPPAPSDLTYTNGASGACEISGSVTSTISGSYTECGGTYTETWTYTDDCGRTITASRTITVDPAALAVFEATDNISIPCGSAPPTGTLLSYTNGETGACEISGSVTGTINGSHTECGGIYTETWTYTDDCGRTITVSRIITVEPAAVAEFAPTTDISIACGSAPPVPSDLSYTNGASGECEISGSVTSTINGSYTECGGTYTETWTYTDDCARTITASRTITVEPAAVAAFAPTSDISIACGSAPPAPSDLSYTNGASGACEISGSVTGSIIGSHTECGGIYTETWTYTDDCGRTIDATRTITVEPAAVAAFAPTSDISIACGSAPPAPSDLSYTNGASGACEITGSVTSTINGSYTECGGTYTETWTFTDNCGRTIDATRTITVEPAAQAAFAPTSDINIACGSAPPAPSDLSYTNGASGACEISGSVTGTIIGSHTECGGTYTETWTYTDDCGRTIDASRTITVDPAAVAAFAPTSDINIACGSAPPTPSDLSYTNGASGACEISGSVTGTIIGSHTECGGTYTESWTYTDDCGRTIDATRIITVEPAAVAAFAPTSDISIACGSAPPAPSDLTYTNGASGACEISGSVTGSIIGSHTECGGTYTETWTYTDAIVVARSTLHV